MTPRPAGGIERHGAVVPVIEQEDCASGGDVHPVAVVGPFQVALRLQEPAAPRIRPAVVRTEDPPHRAGPVHLDQGVLVPQGDDERVVRGIVGQRIGVRPVADFVRMTEGAVGVAQKPVPSEP